jgi:hypothetical protein
MKMEAATPLSPARHAIEQIKTFVRTKAARRSVSRRSQKNSRKN